MDITTNNNFDRYLKHYQQQYQLGIISLVHDRGLIVYFLTMTGLLHVFDVILTSSDIIPSPDVKEKQFTNINFEKYQIFYDICSRLSCDVTKTAFIIDLSSEDKSNLSNFKFIDLSILPDYTLFHSQSSSSSESNSSIKKQSTYFRNITSKSIIVWLTVSFIITFLSIIMFDVLNSLNIYIITK